MRYMEKRRSDSKAILLNIIWAVLAILVKYAINFLTTPYVTNNIGVEAYGFVSLANTFTSYIDLISIALNSFASRYIAIAYHQNDLKKAEQLYSSVIVADCVLSLLVFVPSLFIIRFLEKFLNIPDLLVNDVKILFIVVLIKYLLTVMQTAFNVSTFIKNRLDLSERQKTTSTFIQGAVLLVLCVALAPKVWYVGIAAMVSAAYLLLVNIRNAHRLIPELKYDAKKFSIDSVKELVSSGIWNSINNLGNVLNSGLDLIITNLMLTATAMGQISVAKNLATICYTLVGTIANAFKPLQTRYYAEGNTELLVSSLKRSMKITGLVCGLLIAGFFSYGTPFLRLWLTDSQNISLIFKISMIVLFSDIVIGVVNPLYYVYTLTNKLRLPCYITLAMGTANVIGMYVLIKYTSLGEYAVVLTTMVLNLIHLIDAPIYSAYCLKIKISTFYPVILRHLIACVVNVILIRVLAGVLPYPSSWLILCVDCLIVGVCALLVEFIVLFDRNEISEFARKVKNKIA